MNLVSLKKQYDEYQKESKDLLSQVIKEHDIEAQFRNELGLFANFLKISKFKKELVDAFPAIPLDGNSMRGVF